MVTGAEYLALRSGDVIKFRGRLRVVVAPGPIGVTLRKLRPGRFPQNPMTTYTYGEIAEGTVTMARAKLTRAERIRATDRECDVKRDGWRQARIIREAWQIDQPKYHPVPLKLIDDDGRWEIT